MFSVDFLKTLNLKLLTLNLCLKFSGEIRWRSSCSHLLRNSRTICWPAAVLDSWDARFVRPLNNRASSLPLSLFRRRTSRGSSEDSVLYGSRLLVRLVSILLMSLSVTKKIADFQELDLLPFVFGKIARLLDVRVAKLASARCNRVLRYSSPKY